MGGGKMKLATVVGARPQLIKASALSRAIGSSFSSVIEEVLVHTEQHYDDNMSASFFRELGMTEPTVGLGLGSRGGEVRQMVGPVSEVLAMLKPDAVLVYGDTNSTLAGAIAAKLNGLPLVHVEAGLRSWNWEMPEEENRVVTDHMSDLLFCPTQTSVDNLEKEGIKEGRTATVRLSGDVMLDNAMFFSDRFSIEDLAKRFGTGRDWMLLTLHRGSNVDNLDTLTEILAALESISAETGVPMVMPVHPRTAKTLAKLNYRSNPLIQLTDPMGYAELLGMARYAKSVFTDSGGVQKEAGFFGTPCYIIRDQTEWTELVTHMGHVLAGTKRESIIQAFRSNGIRSAKSVDTARFGDGKAAEHICREILKWIPSF